MLIQFQVWKALCAKGLPSKPKLNPFSNDCMCNDCMCKLEHSIYGGADNSHITHLYTSEFSELCFHITENYRTYHPAIRPTCGYKRSPTLQGKYIEK